MLLESSPIPFRPEIVAKGEAITEKVHISGASEDTKPLMKVRGVFQRYDERNQNGRIYPRELFTRCLNEEGWKDRLSENSVIGLVEHPEDGITRLTGPLSHVVTKAYDNNDGTIWGECLILNTPDGQKMGALFEAGVPVGISSRGEGEVESMDESTQRVIPDSFTLITWDFVADNSVPGAKVYPVREAQPKPHRDMTIDPTPSKITVTPTNRDNEYLRPVPNGNPPVYMSKIGEMRKVDLDLRDLKKKVDSDISFQARVALSEEAALLKGRINSYIKEDSGVEAYGKKLLKEADDFTDEIEGAPPTDAVPDSDFGEIRGEEEMPPIPGGEEGTEEPKVDKAAFDTVMQAVLSDLAPEAAEGEIPGEEGPEGEIGGEAAGADVQAVIDDAYDTFNTEGEIHVDELVGQLQGEEEAEFGEEEAGFEPDEAISDVVRGEEGPGGPPGAEMGEETAFESRDYGRELRAAVRLIARLRESSRNGEAYRRKVNELSERLKAHHPYLKELEAARPKLKAANENAARLQRNVALLGRAKSEIDRLKGALSEEKEVSGALVRLLNEHGIRDASRLIEDTREAARQSVESTSGAIAKALKEEDDNVTELATGEDIENLGPGECDIVKPSSGRNPTGDVPSENLEDGTGETPQKVDGEDQTGWEITDKGAVQKCKPVNPSGGGGSSYHPATSGASESRVVKKNGNGQQKAKLEEKKIEEEQEHDLLRYLRRYRTNPYDQLLS